MCPVSMETDGTGWDAVGDIQAPEQGFSPSSGSGCMGITPSREGVVESGRSPSGQLMLIPSV